MSPVRHPADQPQRQRDLGLPGQRRVAAGEDQPEPVVGHGLLTVGLLRVRRRRRARPAGAAWRAASCRGAATSSRLAPGGGGQPGAGLGRDAVAGPGVQRGDVGVLDALLGQVEVAGDAHRRGEHDRPLATVRVGDRPSAVCRLTRCERHEQRPHLDAAVDLAGSASRSRPPGVVGRLDDEEPGDDLLASRNGPSVTRSPRTAVAVALGCRAKPVTIRPPSSSTCAGYRLSSSR